MLRLKRLARVALGRGYQAVQGMGQTGGGSAAGASFARRLDEPAGTAVISQRWEPPRGSSLSVAGGSAAALCRADGCRRVTPFVQRGGSSPSLCFSCVDNRAGHTVLSAPTPRRSFMASSMSEARWPSLASRPLMAHTHKEQAFMFGDSGLQFAHIWRGCPATLIGALERLLPLADSSAASASHPAGTPRCRLWTPVAVFISRGLCRERVHRAPEPLPTHGTPSSLSQSPASSSLSTRTSGPLPSLRLASSTYSMRGRRRSRPRRPTLSSASPARQQPHYTPLAPPAACLFRSQS